MAAESIARQQKRWFHLDDILMLDENPDDTEAAGSISTTPSFAE
jgi:hypothetical protein